jgi:hypothetical protein
MPRKQNVNIETSKAWGDDPNQAKIFAKTQEAIYNLPTIRKRASASDIYRDVLPDTGVRDGFSRHDYDVYRPDETIPKDRCGVLKKIEEVCEHNGLANSFINLLTDFTIQGIHLIHPTTSGKKLYNAWWSKVNGYERSERFVTSLLMSAMAGVQRTTAKIPPKVLEQLKKGFVTAEADEVAAPIPSIPKNEIPYSYRFLNPETVEVMAGDLGVFAGLNKYVLQIPRELINKIQKPANEEEREAVKNLPESYIQAAKTKNGRVPLDPDKVSIYHFKKSDWKDWAKPILYPVLNDFITIEKLKLADRVALDGAISHIRIWKLGNLENKILPDEGAVSKLAGMLMNNVGGGTMDLIWTPDIELSETGTEIHKFLGNEKYVPHLNAIYAGLGIPQSLTGGSGTSGFSNNYISLQTLLERLVYIRNILVEFWDREIRIFQRAFRLPQPAQIRFSRMTLADQAAEKKIVLDMVDRNIISIETAQEVLGEIPELENIRLRKQRKIEKKRRSPPKLGPFADPETTMKAGILQGGHVTPSEAGLELDERDPKQTPVIDKQLEVQKQKNKATKAKAKAKGKSGQGRPKNSKDSTTRKKKRVRPRTAASIIQNYTLAREKQQVISDIVDPLWLATTGKKNMRSLSQEEFDNIEKTKFAILCKCELDEELTEEAVVSMIQGETLCIPTHVTALYDEMIKQYRDKGKELTVDIARQIQAMVCGCNSIQETEDSENAS